MRTPTVFRVQKRDCSASSSASSPLQSDHANLTICGKAPSLQHAQAQSSSMKGLADPQGAGRVADCLPVEERLLRCSGGT